MVRGVFFAFYLLALFLPLISPAQRFLKDTKPDIAIASTKLNALLKLQSWHRADEINPEKNYTGKGIGALLSSPDKTLRFQAEFLQKVIGEVTFKDVELSAYIDWYEGLVAANDTERPIGFQLANDSLQGEIERIETEIAQIRQHHRPELIEIDRARSPRPTVTRPSPTSNPISPSLLATLDDPAEINPDAYNPRVMHDPETNAFTIRAPQIPIPELTATATLDGEPMPMDSAMSRQDGLSGPAANYAIEIERSALEERLATFSDMLDNPELPESHRVKIAEAVKEAQLDIKKFEAEVSELSVNRSPDTSLLSLTMGTGYSSPDYADSFRYAPYSHLASDYDQTRIEAQMQRSREERQRALESLAMQETNLKLSRAMAIDSVLPGYPELETKHNELMTEISKMSSEIISRNNFGVQDIIYRRRIYPIRNQELNLWRQLEAIDKLQRNEALSPSEIKDLQELNPTFIPRQDLNSSEIEAWKAIQTEVINRLQAEIKTNTAFVQSEKDRLLGDLQKNQDLMNRQRLGLDQSGIDERIAGLEALKKEAQDRLSRNRSDFNERKKSMSNPEEIENLAYQVAESAAHIRARVENLDLRIDALKQTKARFAERKPLATRHYNNNLFFKRHQSTGSTEPGKIQRFANAFTNKCQALVQKAALFLSY
jgi:hypothetical protein